MKASVGKLRRSLTIAVSMMATLSMIESAINVNFSGAAQARSKPIGIKQETGQILAKNEKFSGNGSGTLLAMLPSGKQLGTCPLKHTAVKASVAGYVARVSVKQSFHNTFKDKIEAVYTFPLPENAAVDEMTMRIGNRTIHGTIKKREEAREIYEQAKSHGHVASLLDQERPNIFTQSVANIEPGETVEIEIKYVDLLPYEAGTFTFAFPTVVGPRFNPGNVAGKSGTGREPDTDVVPDASKITPPVAPEGQRAGHDLSIELSIDSGVPLHNLSSKLHEVQVNQAGTNKAQISLVNKQTIPNKDFVLSWEVASDRLQSGYLTHNDGKSGFFTVMMLPPKKVTPENVAPKEMVFLIDCSGSQNGAPLDKAKETMEYIIDHMNANDTFQIISFSDHLTQFADRPQKVSSEMRQRARRFIQNLSANGGTWMAPAVERVCAMPTDENRLRIVSFMTDGYVGNDFEILGLIRKYRSKTRWFPFGTGNSVNRFLIDGIAKEGGGEAEYVLLNSPGNVVGKKFYDRISSPVLTDVKLECKGVDVKEVFPHNISDVWAERPLYFKGRYTAPGAGTISLTGFAAGKPYKQDLKVVFPAKQSDNEVIKPIWARAKVDRLMSEDWFGAQQGQVNKELKEEIVKTALDYHIMTQYTSFVAVEETRQTKNGDLKQVVVPVEMPEGVSRELTVGGGGGTAGGAGFMNGSISTNIGKAMTRYSKPGGYAPMPASLPAPSPISASSSNALQKTTSVRVRGTLQAKEVKYQEADGSLGQMVDQSAPEHRSAAKDEESKKNDAGRIDKSKLSIELQSLGQKRKQTKIDQMLEIKDGKVLIKILLTDSSESVIKQLKKLGLEVKSIKGKTVIGSIAIESLELLIKLKEVLKIQSAP